MSVVSKMTYYYCCALVLDYLWPTYAKKVQCIFLANDFRNYKADYKAIMAF